MPQVGPRTESQGYLRAFLWAQKLHHLSVKNNNPAMIAPGEIMGYAHCSYEEAFYALEDLLGEQAVQALILADEHGQ